MKTAKQLERYFKGASNHYRIKIMFVVNGTPGIAVEEIAEGVEGNLKTVSAHTQSLVRAGLLNKRYQGRHVVHNLSPFGEKFVEFMKTF